MNPSQSEKVDLYFVYHVHDESISCNLQYLTKNVPARILRKLLESHLSGKRTQFEYREFKRDNNLFFIRKTTNFEIRLRRLMKLIREKYPHIQFEKLTRGKFYFFPGDGVRVHFNLEEV